MARRVSIKPLGIVRNTTDARDGDCQELINMRFKDNSWRAVGEKESLYSFTSDKTLKDWYYHSASGLWICFNETDWKIQSVDMTLETPTLVDVLTLDGEDVFQRFSHLNKTIIVWCENTKYILYYNEGTYVDITELPLPNLAVGNYWETGNTEISVNGETFDTPDYPDYGYSGQLNIKEYWRKYVYSYLLSKWSEAKQSNLMEGFVVFRVAYRLFDGNYILHNVPLIHHIAHKHGTYDGTANPYIVEINSKPFFAEISNIPVEIYIGGNYIANTKIFYEFSQAQCAILQNFVDAGIIESFDVFATRIIPAYDYSRPITEWTITGSNLFTPPVTEDIETKLLSDGQFYKVASVPFNKITELAEHITLHTDYYHLACNQIIPDLVKEPSPELLLPADSFTHHTLLAEISYSYNTRIHAGDITNILANPINNIFSDYMMIPAGNNGFTYNETLNADERSAYIGKYIHSRLVAGTVKWYCEVTIRTDDGIKTVRTQLPDNFSRILTHGLTTTFATPIFIYNIGNVFNYALYLNPLIIYPDYRATKITFSYEYNSIEYLLGEYLLIPSVANNYAYYTDGIVTDDGSNCCFYPIKLDMGTSLVGSTVHTPATIDNTYTDSNRIQVSAFNNPLFWDSKNSYRIGNPENIIIGLDAAMSAMSDTAWGKYPLYAFTSSGTFALSQGTGEVLYASIQPFNSLKLVDSSCKININGAIFFSTSQGVYALIGSQAVEISTQAEGNNTNPLIAKQQYINALSENKLPQLYNHTSNPVINLLTGEDFKTFLASGVKMGYDYENNEIILSGQGYYVPAYAYSYVYSITNKVWSTVTQVYSDFLIKDSRYIGIQLTEDDGDFTSAFVNLDTETTPAVDIYALIQTRPLQLQSSGLKRIEASLAKLVRTETEVFTVYQVWGSNDEKNWSLCGYIQATKDRNIYTRRLPYNMKYYIFVLAFERTGATFDTFELILEDRFVTRAERLNL